MITLYQFPKTATFPNLSPFCVKLETYLKMANIPYDVVLTTKTDKSPKGKMPYIKYNDVMMSDSSFIIEKLMQDFGDSTETHLSPALKAQGLAIQRLCEDHLAYALMYFRWIDDTSWPFFKEIVFGKMPTPLKLAIPKIVQKGVRTKLKENGILDHSRDEILQLSKQNLKALSDILGDQKFFFGDRPTLTDAIVFAFVGMIHFENFDNPLKTILKGFPELKNHSENMKNIFFPS